MIFKGISHCSIYRFNLEAGKAAALGHTWSGATHVPDLGLGRKREERKKLRARERKRGSPRP